MKTNIFKHISLLLSASAMLCAASCTDSVVESIDHEENNNVQLIKNINADVEAFEIGDEQTRSFYKEVENGYQFVWEEDDMIGVWGVEKLDDTPCDGPLNFMSIEEGAGSSSVKFDGGDWSLRSDTKYLAFYPFNKNDLTDEHVTFDRTSRVLSYDGQIVYANAPMLHVNQYDYLTTEAQKADANGNINFKFNHLGSLYCFKFKFPRGTEVNNIVLDTKNPTYAFNSNIMVNEYGSIVGATRSQKFTLLVDGSYTVDNAGNICIYAMISGDDQSDIKISGTVNTNKGVYSFTEQGKQNTPGKIYVIERDWLTNYSATLLSGSEFGDMMAEFVPWATSSTRHDYQIKKIYFRHVAEGDLPSSPYSFAAEGSKYPIVGRYTKETDVLEILTTADEIIFTDCKYMFSSCQALQYVDFSIVNTSKVKNFSHMFEDCQELSSLNISSFDTSAATTMNCMFYNCYKLTGLVLSSFDTSNVTDMGGMFWRCKTLKTLDLSSFNTSKVTDMANMFNGSLINLIDLRHFDTSNVMYMNSMFRYTTTNSIRINNFNLDNVKNMDYMFADCTFSYLYMNNISGNYGMSCNQMFDGTTGEIYISDDLYNYINDNFGFSGSNLTRP